VLSSFYVYNVNDCHDIILAMMLNTASILSLSREIFARDHCK